MHTNGTFQHSPPNTMGFQSALELSGFYFRMTTRLLKAHRLRNLNNPDMSTIQMGFTHCNWRPRFMRIRCTLRYCCNDANAHVYTVVGRCGKCDAMIIYFAAHHPNSATGLRLSTAIPIIGVRSRHTYSNRE